MAELEIVKFDLEKESDRKKILDIFFTEKGFNEVKKAKMIDKIFEDVEDEQEAKDAMDELTTMSAKRRAEHLQELQEQEVLKEREAQETYTAAHILLHLIERKDVSEDDIKFLKAQSFDVVKVLALIGIQAIPGSCVAILALEKAAEKYGFTLFPTSQKINNDGN